jgi:hypothetical protein
MTQSVVNNPQNLVTTGSVDSITGLPVIDKSTDSAAHAYEQGLGAGERNVDSATDGYQVVREECNLTLLTGTAARTIGGGVAGDTHLMAIHVTTATVGTVTIAGFANDQDAAANIVLPIGTAVGQYDFKGAINSKGALTITLSSSTDNNDVQVLWKAK